MRIFVEFDEDVFRLMVDDGKMRPGPVGARLFRAPPHPEVTFEHETLEAAETDAAKVRAYLAALPTRKQTKKELREAAA